jgi:hypothetical protein
MISILELPSSLELAAPGLTSKFAYPVARPVRSGCPRLRLAVVESKTYDLLGWKWRIVGISATLSSVGCFLAWLIPQLLRPAK